MGHQTHMRRLDQARELRRQWLQAIADKRDHGFVNAKWVAYESLANLAGVFNQVEKEAARDRGDDR